MDRDSEISTASLREGICRERHGYKESPGIGRWSENERTGQLSPLLSIKKIVFVVTTYFTYFTTFITQFYDLGPGVERPWH